MVIQEATDEYRSALKQGQKEYKELLAAGKNPYPAVLDDILSENPPEFTKDIGLMEIPMDRIVGTTAAGRITAFTANFKPLLSPNSEFGIKWVQLCSAHLTEQGIRDPIVCYEYLGSFYVQEGNKRVSVLRHFGAPRIAGIVKRVIPPMSDDPAIKAYYEFLDFYQSSKLYCIQFRNPGDYAKLLAYLGKESGEEWTDRERKTFTAYFQYFRDAFESLNVKNLDILPEEALLLWLSLYPFRDLGKLSTAELTRTLSGLWDDVVSTACPDNLKLQTEPPDAPQKTGILNWIISPPADHLNIAFVQPRDPEISPWTMAHDNGRQYLEHVLGNHVTVRSYFHADTPEETEKLLEQAVEEGAEVVFTTTPQLSRSTLKSAVKHPKIRFLNCSVNVPYSSIRTYYSRVFEGKFITGAIAGAMTKNDRIGYIGSYPIYGVPASINAFALGAQMTNPDAKIELRWSCQPGNPMEDFMKSGIQVVSNRDIPSPDKCYLEEGNYGTYLIEENGTLKPLGSPVWLWGKFYENVVRSILDGSWEDTRNDRPVNYWWGMNSGVIDVKLSDYVPQGVRILAKVLRKALSNGTLDPFFRRIVTQDGTLINDGSRTFHPDELLRMNWLCENVTGSIPRYDEILPIAQPMVRELGVYCEQIPIDKEWTL